MKLLIAVLALVLVSGCAHRAMIPVCLPVAEYDEEFQNRLADELEGLPPGSALFVAIRDFYIMRQAARACQK